MTHNLSPGIAFAAAAVKGLRPLRDLLRKPFTAASLRVYVSQGCPFGRMASAQVLLGPTPFCRKDTLLLTIRTTHKPATDLWIPAAQAARPCAMVASSLLSGVLSRWFNYAVSGRCDPKGLHINKRIK
jgi:hypothetical protein